MTAPVAQSQFTASHVNSNLEVATMWRGAAVDIFAGLEATALSFLMALNTAEEAKPKASDFVAWPRFSRLTAILMDARFAPWNGKALQLLEQIELERELRTAVAHGRLKLAAAGISLSWRALENGAWQPRVKSISWVEALETLGRLGKLRRDLSSQLGQIRRHCLRANTKHAL